MYGKLWIIPTLIVLGIAWTWALPTPGEHSGGIIGHKGHHDYYAHPKYKFGYGVKDGKTSDKKSAAEWRDGHTVKCHYSLQEPDGSWRTVNYVADEHGFRAQVSKTPLHHG